VLWKKTYWLACPNLRSPLPYRYLSEVEKETIAELTSDFCIIRHPEQTEYYIRCTLIQKVIDHCEDLHYGLWSSLSEKSFLDYSENFKNQNHENQYFGWLSNNISEYDFKEYIPTTVVTQTNGNRPEIFPHEDFEHPFVIDYYKGITKKEAENRIQTKIATTCQNKPWWKVW